MGEKGLLNKEDGTGCIAALQWKKKKEKKKAGNMAQQHIKTSVLSLHY